MTEVLLWATSALLIVAGLAGAVLPALPGPVLVLAGVALGAWIDGFARVSLSTVGVVAALAVLAWVLDQVAGLLGARRAGAGRKALIGAAIGTVAGLFMGLVGVFVMPFVGAVVGEWLERREHGRALEVGLGTWLGLMAGLAAKVVIGLAMVGIYVAALWW